MAKMVIGIGNGAPEQLLLSAALATKAVELGLDVDIFLFQGGMQAFRDRGVLKHPLANAADVPDPLQGFARLRATGKARIHACPTDAGRARARLKDFSPLVDDVVGLGSYVDSSEGPGVLHAYFGPCAEEKAQEPEPRKPTLQVL